jgi:hypothetical protein
LDYKTLDIGANAMRDRIRTPFPPLSGDDESPQHGQRSPGGPAGGGPNATSRGPLRPLRTSDGTPSLRGRTVSDGRYLLLRKLGQERRAARWLARDSFSGLEVEIELTADPTARRGYRIGSASLPARRDLPNLLDPPITTEILLPPARRRRVRSIVRMALRRTGTEG